MKSKLTRLAENQDWVPVAGQLMSLAQSWADRSDLRVYCGRDGAEGTGTVAVFYPDDFEIEVNSNAAFGMTPADRIGNLLDRMVLATFPVAGGMLLHESMHARFSTADLGRIRQEYPPHIVGIYELTEETRVEGRGVICWPADTPYLRSCAKAIVISDHRSPGFSPRFGALVILGRHAVGVLTAEDVAPVRSHLLNLDGWTVDILDQLYALLKENVMLDDATPSDMNRIMEIAAEIDRLLPKDPAMGGEGGGEPGESGEGESGLEGLIEAILDALGHAESEGAVEAVEGAQAGVVRERKQKAREEKDRQRDNEIVATDVFPRDGSFAGIPSELQGARMPSSSERAAAVKLAKQLQKARYRTDIVTEFRSEIPGGKLHGGEAMRRDAAVWANGDASRFKPFVKQQYTETDEPPLTVGIMCDTSGSMKRAQPAVGVANYVISDAVYRVGRSEAAMVYFGERVAPGLRRGERMKDVRTWTGGGGYEDFDRGFRALDGELNLLNGQGARLLVVISDGDFKLRPQNQISARDKWIATCVKSGVAVLWIQLSGQSVSVSTKNLELVHISDGDILAAVNAIGLAAVRALRSAGK